MPNAQPLTPNAPRPFPLQRVLIERGCEHLPYTREIISHLPDAQIDIIPSVREHLTRTPLTPAAITEGKQTLLLMKNRGGFFKPCPGTQRHLCCLYKVLHHAAGCPLDCSYCILQVYLNNPYIVYYVNIDDMLKELRDVFSKNRGQVLRLGTGEFTDSLALENITHTTEKLLPLLREFPDVFIELKTKTADIETVLGAEPRGRIIFAWSLNPDVLIDREEKGAASLNERLYAAKKAQESGHPVAFHFDPLLRFEGWEDAYREVVEQLADAVDLSRAFWVSLGSFRFPPHLKPIIEARFPESRILYEEFIMGEDGKMRYFKPLRIEMYSMMVRWLREAAPDVFMYFCMERADVWDAVFGFHPVSNEHLKEMLDARCHSPHKHT